MRAQIHSNPYTHSRHTLHILIQHTTMGYVLVYIRIYLQSQIQLLKPTAIRVAENNERREINIVGGATDGKERPKRESHTERDRERAKERERRWQ